MKVKTMLIQILNIYRLFLVWLMVLLDNKNGTYFDEIDHWNSYT